jgi:hypothetical protein
MQATYELKPFPFQIVVFVFALLAAVIIGGLGGYWVKSLDHQGTSAAAAVTTVRQPSLVGENAAQSIGGVSMVGENAREENGWFGTSPAKLREGHRR